MSKIMVRPATRALPRMEEWAVERRCPVTGALDSFGIICVEGSFFSAYRQFGLTTPQGVEFNPVADMERGYLHRRRIRTFR